MDFLKSAVASIAKGGPSFGYSSDERVDINDSIWTLHNGTKREDGSKCSVFTFDIALNRNRLPLARNALRKLRTLRHPGVIKVLDTLETESYIYIATERVTPLSWHVKRKSLAPETTKWGLFSLAKTIKFINDDAKSVHGYIRTSTVFTSESGEWKLGGFDILSSMNDDEACIYSFGGLTPNSSRYSPPEVVKMGWEAIKKGPVPAIDAYLYGILIYEAFNASFNSIDQLSSPKNIPNSMQTSYKRLVSANPKIRSSTSQFLEQGLAMGSFFDTPLIHLTDGIENLGIKDEAERDELLSQVEGLSEDFPEDFFKMKVLPELLKSMEFGGGGSRVFSVIMKISTKLSDEEYDQQLTPVIIRLFKSPDRALRVCLLENLPQMIDHLSQKNVSNNIFPQLVTGFTDVAPLVREQTVKAVLVVVTKLSDRVINGELLRYLAKTANDEQPGIRTNTTICLGKIAKNLSTSTRSKVLIAAFAKALRDPFVHARNASLMAFAATSDFYSDEDCATKILPGLCPSLVDKEKMIRDQANKTHDIFLQRIRKYAQTLPDTVQPPPSLSSTGTPRMGTPSITETGSTWTGWAISSFTNKLSTINGDISSHKNGTSLEERPQSVPTITPSFNKPSPLVPAPISSSSSNVIVPTISSFNTKKESNPFSGTSTPTQPAEPQDFDSNWNDNSESNNWGTEDDPFAPNNDKANDTVDDKGEPDFAAWLSSQQKTTKKTIPKGLVKTGATVKPVNKSKPSTDSVPKKIPAKPLGKKITKPTEVEENWGDDW